MQHQLADLGHFILFLILHGHILLHFSLPLAFLLQTVLFVLVMADKVHVDLDLVIMLDLLRDLESKPVKGDHIEHVYHQQDFVLVRNVGVF